MAGPVSVSRLEYRPFAIITITAALVFYSVGVWAEKLQRTLKPWHVAMFLLGLTMDATGTWLMSRIESADLSAVRTPLMATMAVTGAAALALMADTPHGRSPCC